MVLPAQTVLFEAVMEMDGVTLSVTPIFTGFETAVATLGHTTFDVISQVTTSPF